MKKSKKTQSQKQLQRNKCSLFPVIREDLLTIQDVQQKAGWQITAFNLPDAWRITQGEGVKIAILDTGCDLDHPDLVENLLPGFNFVNPSKKPIDDNQHGTHATGIICASNNDIGVVGVAPKCKVMPVKTMDKKGNGNMPIVSQGIRWAVDNGADIISMSLGCPYPIQEVRKAIQYAEKQGIPVFVAAGNSGFTEQAFYPASYPETIAIGSIDENFDRSKFSCTGKNIDFMAPGGSILSTVPDNWYAILSGTSMATPWAAGIAALILSCSRQGKIKAISIKCVDDYRTIFQKYATDINNKKLNNKEFYQGFGIIDPRKLLEAFQKL